MKGAAGVKPIIEELNSVYFEPSTPEPSGSTMVAATTSVQTGDISADCMYDLFTTVDDLMLKLASSDGVAAMSLSHDYPVPEKLPWRFYSGKYRKFGVRTWANTGGKVWISKVVGDDDR